MATSAETKMGCGLNVIGGATLVMIVCKLLGIWDLSWWEAFAPVWAPVFLMFLVFLFSFAVTPFTKKEPLSKETRHVRPQ